MKESSKAILFSNNIRDNLCGLCEITALVLLNIQRITSLQLAVLLNIFVYPF